TQPSIGRFEVSLKADRFKLMSSRDLDGYLDEKRDKDKAVRVVKRRRRFFVVDGHHTLSAIRASGIARELELDLIEDYSDASDDHFWSKMRENHWLFLRCKGERLEPEALPGSLDALVDDPFRSIAWLIRKMGAYEDLKVPYQEFAVADFLREHIRFAPKALHEYETASVRAFELMRSRVAEERSREDSLLGFISGEFESEELVNDYYSVIEKARAPRHYGR
ncbi:MAG: ParB/Srx family N-terminal domain-containing protein, partial [Myxococcota bacterium]